MLLTVVIPNYNNEKYIDKCIASVVCQTYDPIEVLVVDDCSTDDSLSIVNYWMQRDSRIRLVCQRKNEGVSRARNRGLELARGEYITFLDGDDFYQNKDKLQCEMKIIQNHIQEGKDVVAYSKVVHVNENGMERKKQPKGKWLTGDIYNQILRTYRTATLPRDYCVKTDRIKEVGGYKEDLKLYEDYDLLLRLAQNLSFCFTGVAGTAYRIKTGGLSSCPCKVSDKVMRDIFEIYNSKENIIKRCCNRVIKYLHGAIPMLSNRGWEIFQRILKYVK